MHYIIWHPAPAHKIERGIFFYKQFAPPGLLRVINLSLIFVLAFCLVTFFVFVSQPQPQPQPQNKVKVKVKVKVK